MTPTRLSLNCNFAAANFLDPIFTFSRPSGATRINPQTGLIETVAANVPRIEKDGLLIEGAATNLIGYSAPIAWNHGIAGAVACLGPDGTMTALRLPAGWGRAPYWSGINTGTLTGSIYARAVTGSPSFYFTLGPGRSVQTILTQEWQRVQLTVDYSEYVLIDEIPSGHAIEIACLQLEAGPIASSYIPTFGAPATRAAELCFTEVSAPWFGRNGFTLCAAVNKTSGNKSGSDRIFEMGYIGWGNSIVGAFQNEWVTLGVNVNGASQVGSVKSALVGSNKMAMSYKVGKAALSINGSIAEVAESVSLPEVIARLTVGHAYGGGGELFGHIRSLQILPHAVSDGVLQAMSR